MKVNVRNNIFETNSSSTHSFVSTVKDGKNILEKSIIEYIKQTVSQTYDYEINALRHEESEDVTLRVKEANYYGGDDVTASILVLLSLQSKIDFLIIALLDYYGKKEVPKQIEWIKETLEKEGYNVFIDIRDEDCPTYYCDDEEKLNVLNLDTEKIESIKSFTKELKKIIKSDNYIVSQNIPYHGNLDIRLEIV